MTAGRKAVVSGLAGESAGAAAVVAGTALEVPGFGPRTGFRGSHALDSMLYAIGHDTLSIAVVMGCYFTPGFRLAVGAFLFVRGLRRGSP